MTKYIQKVTDKKILLILGAGLLASTLLCSNAMAGTLVTEWDDVTLDAIRAVHPAPTVVSRSLAMVHTSIFDAWAAYDSKAAGTLLGKSLRRPVSEHTEANKKAALSYAAYDVLVSLFPSEKSRFDTKMRNLGYDPDNASKDKKTAAGVGHVAAAALLDYRRRDGAKEYDRVGPTAQEYADYTHYKSVNTVDNLSDPDRWQPLNVPNHIGCHGDTELQIWCTPQWGKVKPFALKSGNQFRPAGPAKADQALYKEQADQVIKYTADLNDNSKAIAEYWADGPTSELPPGHWAIFSTFVSNRDHNTLDQDVVMFFAVTNAVFDAGIAAWDAKRAYDSVRPISAIRKLYKDKMIPSYDGQMVLGQNWLPYQPKAIVTPPFAEYVSGHSAFSRAAAEILKRFTGSDYFGFSTVIPAGQSRIQPGVVPAKPVQLAFDTFTDAADQAGLSRRYGGIHFAQGDLQGRQLGEKVAGEVWKHVQDCVSGKMQTM
jgi:hypothetical protein